MHHNQNPAKPRRDRASALQGAGNTAYPPSELRSALQQKYDFASGKVVRVARAHMHDDPAQWNQEDDVQLPQHACTSNAVDSNHGSNGNVGSATACDVMQQPSPSAVEFSRVLSGMLPPSMHVPSHYRAISV